MAGFGVSLTVLPRVVRAIGPRRTLVVGLAILAAGHLWLAYGPTGAGYAVAVLPSLLLVATGEHVDAPGVIYTTASRVVVRSAQTVPVQIDGEAAGHTPLEIEMLKTRIPFLVP